MQWIVAFVICLLVYENKCNIPTYSKLLKHKFKGRSLKLSWQSFALSCIFIPEFLQGITLQYNLLCIRPGLGVAEVSIWLSVTLHCLVKTLQATITKPLPLALQMTVFRIHKLFTDIRKGSPWPVVVNKKGVGKICYFQPIRFYISEMVQGKAVVAISHLIGSPIRAFSFLPQSVTLDDFEWLYNHTLLHQWCRF